MSFSLVIDTQAVAESLQGNAWRWPEEAAIKGRPDVPMGGTAIWTEPVLEIVGSSVAPAEKDPTRIVFELEFAVPADSAESSVNSDASNLKLWYGLYPASIGDPSHDRFKATKFNMSKLSKLLMALGVEIPQSGQIDFGQFFAPQDDGSTFVLNQRVGGILKFQWYEGRPQNEILDFLALDAG